MTKFELRNAETVSAAVAYTAANQTIVHIREAIKARKITVQEARELRNKALAGDVDGVERGLARLVRKET